MNTMHQPISKHVLKAFKNSGGNQIHCSCKAICLTMALLSSNVTPRTAGDIDIFLFEKRFSLFNFHLELVNKVVRCALKFCRENEHWCEQKTDTIASTVNTITGLKTSVSLALQATSDLGSLGVRSLSRYLNLSAGF